MQTDVDLNYSESSINSKIFILVTFLTAGLTEGNLSFTNKRSASNTNDAIISQTAEPETVCIFVSETFTSNI